MPKAEPFPSRGEDSGHKNSPLVHGEHLLSNYKCPSEGFKRQWMKGSLGFSPLSDLFQQACNNSSAWSLTTFHQIWLGMGKELRASEVCDNAMTKFCHISIIFSGYPRQKYSRCLYEDERDPHTDQQPPFIKASAEMLCLRHTHAPITERIWVAWWEGAGLFGSAGRGTGPHKQPG